MTHYKRELNGAMLCFTCLIVYLMSPLTPPPVPRVWGPLSPACHLVCGSDVSLITSAHLYIKPDTSDLCIIPSLSLDTADLSLSLSLSGIMDLSRMLIVFSLVAHSGAFDLGQTTRCVPVPRQMSVCQDVPYSEMRLPNLLGHSSVEEALPRSEEWKTLLHTGCHPQARTFVCSLIAPVCLDRYVQRVVQIDLSSQLACFLL